MPDSIKKVVITFDGGAKPNPGKGYGSYNIRIDGNDKPITKSFFTLLRHRNEFIKIVVNHRDSTIAGYLISLLSTVGSGLLPGFLSYLVEILKANPGEQLMLRLPGGDRIIEHLYKEHLAELVKDPILLNDYLWLLDRKVDYLSSEAYLIREDVITFKGQ